MLDTNAQKVGDTLVLRCHGRIVIGEAYSILRNAVVRQKHDRTLVLDLAQIDRIDAGGLGVLLDLREWAHARGIRFKMMNVMKPVDLLLELTRLDRVFEFCSVEDMFDLLCPTQTIATWSQDSANQRTLTANSDGSLEAKDAPSVVHDAGTFAA